MRVSTDFHDPGYVGHDVDFRAFVDGDNVRGAVTADEERGYVRAYVHDLYGKVVFKMGCPQTTVIEGKVRVKLAKKVIAPSQGGKEDH